MQNPYVVLRISVGMESHSGRSEKTEKFDGKRYTKICGARTKPNAERKATSARKRFDSVRVEPESRGHYNIYGRGRKR